MDNSFIQASWINISEATKFLGVSRMKMAQLLRDGIIPYIQDPLDKRVKLVKRDDLLALKERHAKAA